MIQMGHDGTSSIKHLASERGCQAHLALRLAMAFDEVSGAHGRGPRQVA